MVVPKTGLDHTDAMRTYARRRVAELAEAGLCGFVLKKDSPSCGIERVRVYDARGTPTRSARGLFAQALIEAVPALPVEEEGRLCDPRLRENFVERVFAHRRLRDLFVPRWSIGDLVQFHTAHKLLLLAHSPTAMRIEIKEHGHAQYGTDALILPLCEGESVPYEEIDKALGGLVSAIIAGKEFEGKQNQLALVHTMNLIRPEKILCVGLGKRESLSRERCRQAGGKAISHLAAIGCKTAALPSSVPV